MCFDFSQLTHLDVLVAGRGSDATCCESMLRRHEAMRRFAPHHSCYATQLCGLCYHTRLHYGKAEKGHHRPDTLFGHSPHDAATEARWHLDGQHAIDSFRQTGRLHPSLHKLLDLSPHHAISKRFPRRLSQLLRGSRQGAHPPILHRRPSLKLLEALQPSGGLSAFRLLLRRGMPLTARGSAPH